MVGLGDRDFICLRYCNTSTSTREEISLDSLPFGILEEIIARLPAQDILDVTSRVCRKWYQMTHNKSFIFANLHHSTPGLIIKNLFNSTTYFMYLTRAGQIAISRFNYKFPHNTWSSCHGLILENGFSDLNKLIITNPVTKKHFTLPPFIPSTQPYNRSAIAYVATRMEYKVVRTYSLGLGVYKLRHNACAVFTVGVDKSWRLVDTQHLSLDTCQHFHRTPLVTGDFVHWANDGRGINGCSGFNKKNGISSTTDMSNTYLLTMNMETEMITLYPAPPCNGRYYYKYLSSGGSNLSLLIGRGYLKWDVWEMKPDTGEWTNFPGIDLEARKDLLSQLNDTKEREVGRFKLLAGDPLDIKLTPGGWLKYQEVIIFIVHRPADVNRFLQARLRVVYNLQTQDITVFTLDYNCSSYLVHCNTLIGC